MEFKIEKRINPNIARYREEDLKVARAFAKDILKEFKEFIKAIALFGSTVKAEKPAIGGEKDIDILIVVDDLSTQVTPEFVEAYRIIMEKKVLKHSRRLHITTIKFTNFWEYMRAGDPVGINILRSGLALYDTGFFGPLQALLKTGRIKPSEESIWTYFARAPSTLKNSRWHILQATLDLYWAVIDSAHAVLMTVGEIPPSPSHVAGLMEKKLADKKLIKPKYVETMEKFYTLSKMIVHRQIQEIKGEEYEKYFKEAQEFVEEMRKFIEDKKF